MGTSQPVGTIFVELDLDDSRYLKGQRQLLKEATSTSLNIEQNFKNLGIKSDAVFDLMRKKAENSFEMIANSAKVSKQEISRAQEALNEKLKKLDEQQYGSQRSTIDKIKNHWLAATAAIGAAMGTAYQGWGLAEQAAGYLEQMQLLDGLAQKYNTSASSIVGSIKNVSDGMVSLKTAAEVSTSALAKGLSAEQIISLSQAAVTLSDVMGTTANEAFIRLGSAMETGKEKSIKLAVGVIDLKEKYGIAVDTMTEAQKRQALYNIVMEKTAEIQNRTSASVKSISDEMETFKVAIEDVKLELGVGLVKAGAAAIGVFQWMAAGVLTVASAVPKAIEYVSLLSAKFYELTGQTERAKTAREEAASWSQTYNNMQGAAEELAGKAAEKFALLTATTEQLTTAQNKNAAASKLMSDEATGRYEREKKAAEANKAIEESIRKSQISVDQIRQTTYEKELVRIASEKAEWEKKGADKILIAKWEELEITEAKYKASLERAKNDIEVGTKAVEEENKLRVDGWKALAEKYKEINAAMTEDEKYSLEQRLNQYKEVYSLINDIMNTGAAGSYQGVSMMASSVKGITDVGIGEDKYSKEIEAAQKHYSIMEEMYSAHMETQNLVTEAAANRDLAIERAKKNQKISLASGTFGALSGLMYAFYEASGKQNEVAFIAYKAFAIAQAIVATSLAATQALAQMPYPYNLIAAATVIAAGMAQVVNIASQQIGGGASASASISGSATSASTSTTESTSSSGVSSTSTTTKETSTSINLHVYGNIVNYDEFARQLIPSLAKAVKDGSH